MKIVVSHLNEQTALLVNDGATVSDVLEMPEFKAEYSGAYNKFLNGTQIANTGDVTPDTQLQDGDVIVLAPKKIDGGR